MLIILCAMQKEAVNINCPEALIFQTGIGASNVIKRLQKLKVTEQDKIINIGYAGSTIFKVGEIKTVNTVCKLHPSRTIEEKQQFLTPVRGIEETNCFTVDNFHEDEDIDIPLIDMELYYISLIYPQVQSIKIVSDNAHYLSYKTFNAEQSWGKINEILKELVK